MTDDDADGVTTELYPGKFKPTITHSFIKLLHSKSLLTKHFTQNIDCLDREAGVPGNFIVEAHGSFARQSCIECKEPYPQNLMDEAVQKKEPPHCFTCDGLVKPEIVFFGEALPSEFFEARSVPAEADLIIVMGTSLTVHPFAALPSIAREGVSHGIACESLTMLFSTGVLLLLKMLQHIRAA